MAAHWSEAGGHTFHAVYHQWAELHQEGEEPVAVAMEAAAAAADPLKNVQWFIKIRNPLLSDITNHYQTPGLMTVD